MMLRVRHDHAVDERARHEHLARMERPGPGDPLDLHDHDAARVLDRHRHREIVEVERLALGRHVAVRVGGGAAQEGDVEREAAIEQPFLAVDLHHPDEVFGGDALILPPSMRGSTKVPMPTRESVPGLPAAMSR